MKGMVLAAGYGTRFRPVTHEIPKPMLPVCNRPLIAYAVDSLLAAGIRDVVVNLHHLPEPIQTFLLAEYSGRCTFSFSYEPQILGTGGGVRNVRSLLESDGAFIVVNGDTIQRPPLLKLVEALRETGSLASLLLRRPPPDDRFTPVMFDGRFVTGFGQGTGEALMFAGAHAISSRIFEYVPDRDFSGLTEDVYVPVIRERREKLCGVVYDGVWFDIGTPRRYLSASQAILKLIRSRAIEIPRGSSWEGTSLFGSGSANRGTAVQSVIGDRATIESGSVLTRAVLWNDVRISADVHLEDSVIAQEVELPRQSRVSNALLCNAREGVEYDDATVLIGKFAARAIDSSRAMVTELRGS